MRFPKDSYNSLKYLLGVPVNVVAFYSGFTVPALAPSAAATWDVEELVAMQFTYVRACERVQDVVVTVPAFYAQF